MDFLITALLILSRVSATTLLRGGTFITYSTDSSDLEIIDDGAMLFNDSIIAISQTLEGLDSHLNDSEVQVVNTTGKIISPGFIDTHRHTWEALFRTLGPNVQLASYFWLFGNGGAPVNILSPDDIYVASLIGTLEGLNGGVTTTLDYAHMTWSQAHANASLQGVIDSGARVYWAYAVPANDTFVKSDNNNTLTVNPSVNIVGSGALNIEERPSLSSETSPDSSSDISPLADIAELSKQSPFNDGLVTLSIAYDGFAVNDPLSPIIIETARNLSLGLITAHDVGTVFGGGNIITVFNDLRITPPALNSSIPIVFAHCSSILPTEARLLREFNQYVSITPESEMHYGHGHPHSYLIQDQASLGTDTPFTFSTDIITQMRIWLQSTRLGLYQQELDEFFIPSDTPMSVKQAFLLGTRNGGLALQRPDLGVLNVRAKADVLVFSTDAIGLIGWTDPIAAIILHSNVRDIEQVYVGGNLVKQDGELVFDWKGKGLGKRFQESAANFREGLRRTNITALEEQTKHQRGWTDADFRVPFQVDVTRGDGTGF